MFHPGQLVVCVDASPSKVDGGDPIVRRGHVYEVETIIYDDGITLVGVDPQRGIEGWLVSRFAPIDNNRIAVFRKLLVSPPKELVEP